MTTRNFLFISFIALPIMACSQEQKKEIENSTVHRLKSIATEDDVIPPPFTLSSEFRTIQDWLLNIISGEKPKKSISKFNFRLLESQNQYTLFLTGINTYNDGNSNYISHIEFQPKYMYFRLPKSYHENLNREELLNKLTSQLKYFSTTKEFKASFFTQANIIIFETNGQIIWSK